MIGQTFEFESFVLRILKDAVGLSSALLKHPQFYAYVPEPFFKVARNLKAGPFR